GGLQGEGAGEHVDRVQGPQQFGHGLVAAGGTEVDPVAVHLDIPGPGQLTGGPFGLAGLVGVIEGEADPVADVSALQLLGGVVGDDPSAVDDEDPFRVGVGLLQVVGGEQDRGAQGRAQPGHVLPQDGAVVRVQAG